MAKTEISDYDETDDNNTDVSGIPLAGTVTTINQLDGIVRAVMGALARWTGDDTLASAATTDLGSVPGQYITISGTTTITGLGTIKAGTVKFVKFSGILTLTHNATSLVLPGAANITTTAGDTAAVVSDGSGNWRCLNYQRVASDTITAFVATGSAVALTNVTSATVTSMTLTPGDWEVSAATNFDSSSTTSVTQLIASLSLVNATLDESAGYTNRLNIPATVPGLTYTSVLNGPVRFPVAVNTTVYLVARATFSVSTLAAWGLLRARRIR